MNPTKPIYGDPFAGIFAAMRHNKMRIILTGLLSDGYLLAYSHACAMVFLRTLSTDYHIMPNNHQCGRQIRQRWPTTDRRRRVDPLTDNDCRAMTPSIIPGRKRSPNWYHGRDRLRGGTCHDGDERFHPDYLMVRTRLSRDDINYADIHEKRARYAWITKSLAKRLFHHSNSAGQESECSWYIRQGGGMVRTAFGRQSKSIYTCRSLLSEICIFVTVMFQVQYGGWKVSDTEACQPSSSNHNAMLFKQKNVFGERCKGDRYYQWLWIIICK